MLAPVPALTSAGEEPSAEVLEDAGADVAAAAPVAAPVVAPVASPEKRRVEFDAEQSPAQRGRLSEAEEVALGRERERQRVARGWIPASGGGRGGWGGGRGGYHMQSQPQAHGDSRNAGYSHYK